MTDYIDIKDMPLNVKKPGKWVGRIGEWQNIPPGKALEIDCNTSRPSQLATNLNLMLERQGIESLQAVARGGRLYIVNEAKP